MFKIFRKKVELTSWKKPLKKDDILTFNIDSPKNIPCDIVMENVEVWRKRKWWKFWSKQ